MNDIKLQRSASCDLLPSKEFAAAIHAVGAERYHDKHAFHKLLHGGKLNKGQVQAWALNRYCYQEAVPRKDAAFMSRVHDREYVISMRGALPATRHIVESYVRFVREQPLVVAVASSLTELFAPSIHRERIVGMLQNYDFIDDFVMAYFKRRLTQTPRDSEFVLAYVMANAKTCEEQEACISAVRFKCDMLWAQLDALHHAYVTPGLIPPGTFRSDTANKHFA